MGQNLPSYKPDALIWVESHLADWNDNLAGIGLTSGQVADLTADAVDARDAFTSVQAIRAEAKAQTQTWYSKANGMHKKASELVVSIKAFAANSDDAQAVFELANMTSRNPRSPAPAPTQPVITTASLDGTGSVRIKFDASGPVGTVYIVSRKLASESTFVIVGQAIDKEYVDRTIPGGTASALYTVMGMRGNVSGLTSGPYAVLLGNLPNQSASQAA